MRPRETGSPALAPRDSEELHNLPLLVTVKVRRLEDGDVNDIKGYAPAKGAAPAPAAGPGNAAPAAPSAAPWQR